MKGNYKAKFPNKGHQAKCVTSPKGYLLKVLMVTVRRYFFLLFCGKESTKYKTLTHSKVSTLNARGSMSWQ